MSMGRRESNLSYIQARDTAIKFKMRKVRVSRDGYEIGASDVYWGVGDTLYEVTGEAEVSGEHHLTGPFTETREVYFYVRGASRASAQNEVRLNYPKARFYR